MPTEQINILNPPSIPGLTFRRFNGPQDYTHWASVLTASERADGSERQVSAENIAAAVGTMSNCDPYQDMIFAEIAGEVVGYARGWWWNEPTTGRFYGISGFLVPAWRRKRIGLAMQLWMEQRLRTIASTHPRGQKKFFQVDASNEQVGKSALLENAGYHPERFFFTMVRPTLDAIPAWPIPDGIDVRPVTQDQYRAIWNSADDTSQDEWGYTKTTEEDYQAWLTNSHFQPDLWQIAWDIATEQVVGHVLTYINYDENEQFDRKRGYTEGIGVVKAWRRRGLARALISLSLRAQKAAGMLESALVADSDNQSRATQLYELCGFQVVSSSTIYRKPL